MKDLSITYIQPDLLWEDPEGNLRMFTEKIGSIREETDLILLPEMFSTGFSMRPELFAQEMDGKSVSWMREMAMKKQAVVGGSMIIREQNRFYNRFLWVRPDGSVSSYDKHHLFRYGNEQEHYQAGTEKQIVELKGWKVCPLICYDLRFPVWARNRWREEQGDLHAAYDLLIYVANWPERRSFPWKTLLLARAMENQAYVVGVNRIGIDGNGMEHSGDSAVISFKGDLLSQPNSNKEMMETVSLSHAGLIDFRTTFPAGRDADEFTLG